MASALNEEAPVRQTTGRGRIREESISGDRKSYANSLRRRIPARPNAPVPNKASVPGSGTVVLMAPHGSSPRELPLTPTDEPESPTYPVLHFWSFGNGETCAAKVVLPFEFSKSESVRPVPVIVITIVCIPSVSPLPTAPTVLVK